MAAKDNNCTCSHCGTQFHRKPSQIHVTNFCNSHCHAAFLKGKPLSYLPDITGQPFNRLIVIEFAYTKNGKRYWKCLCECGKFTITTTGHLRTGNTKTCGCGRGAFTHGMNDSPEQSSWESMKSRCLNKNDPNYKHYGGRGITICERWHDFANFYADMGFRPSLKHSIERIDNNGNYEINNCRWATMKEQRRNTRSNHFITFDGETLCLRDWSIKLGVKYTTLSNRLKRWTIEKAMTAPSSSERLSNPTD